MGEEMSAKSGKNRNNVKAVPARPRLVGDDLFTWATVMAEVDNVMQRADTIAGVIRQKHSIPPTKTIDRQGYIVDVEGLRTLGDTAESGDGENGGS